MTLRLHASTSTAVTLIVLAYLAARPASLDERELQAVAAGLRFRADTLGPGAVGDGARRVRRIHPSLEPISGWISAVGAGVALADLDGDGLPNDACHVDPRTDTVTVRPVPGARADEGYAPVLLEAPRVAKPDATAPMGCLPGDLNEDGSIDLLVYFWGRTPVAFLHRGTARQPSYDAVEIVADGEVWYTNAAALADVDGDTHPDLVVGNYFPDGSRILDATDGGRESMQESMSRARNGGRKQILRWLQVEHGVPVFERVEGWIDSDLIHGWALAVGAADLDGDLRPELYFANDFGRDDLLHNRSEPGTIRFAPLRGRRGWTTPGSKVIGGDSFKGMGVDFGDVNGDGWLDIYVSNIAAQFALEESHFLFVSTGAVHEMRDGVAPFVDRSESFGVSRSDWAWDARLADFDNDGTLEAVQATGFLRGDVNRWPELHELAMGNDALLADPRHWPILQPGADLSGRTHNPFFARRGGRFHDVARLVGTGQSQVTRGLAIADVDGDGLLDFAAANQWEPSIFYRNVSEATGSYLGLHLLFSEDHGAESVRHTAGHPQTSSGPAAIGAVVSVSLADGRRLVSQVDGGTGHSGKRSADVHLGLGALRAGETVDASIAWRGRTGLRRAVLTLRPGWHTVWLPRGPTPASTRGGS